jgi:hypothetical protein
MNLAPITDEISQQDFEKIYSIIPNFAKITDSLNAGSVTGFVFFAFMLVFYQKTVPYEIKNKVSGVVMSIAASIALVTGKIFYDTGDFETVTAGVCQMFKIACVIAGYAVFFFHLFSFGLEKYTDYIENGAMDTKYGIFENKYIFFILSGIFLVAWLPILYIYIIRQFLWVIQRICFIWHLIIKQVLQTL